MTTGALCCAKHRPYRRAPARVMDPHFIQLESQLAALRNQRHPIASPTSRLTSSKPLRKSTARARGLAASSSMSSLSALSSSSSLTLSQDAATLTTAEASPTSSPSSSLPSSSSSVESAAAAAEKRERSLNRSQQSLTTATIACESSEQCQPNVTVNQPSSSSSSSAAARLRSIPSISEERSRFRIVKIDTYVDRGRWHCHNFADPQLHDADVARSSSSTQDHLGARGVHGHHDDHDDSPPPSQIYYIAAGGGQGDTGDPSKKFYVSTIVYGEHGHPVLDRTVRMSPLQLLHDVAVTSADDVTVTSADAATETPTPSPRANRYNFNQSLSNTPVGEDVDSDTLLPVTTDNCRDELPVDGHVTSAETDDVTVNDDSPFSGVAMAAHSSMPPMMTSRSMTSEVVAGVYDDVISRRPVTTLPLRRQDDVTIRCHDDISCTAVEPSPANCPTLRFPSADDSQCPRCALWRVYTGRSSPRLSEQLVEATIALCLYILCYDFI